MKVTDDHWIDRALRRPLPGGSAMDIRRCLVIHFTRGATAQSSIDYWRKPEAKGASAHFVIDRDGSLFQCRPTNRTAGHAGESKWRDPKTGIWYHGLNACSIGIELANGGNQASLIQRWSKLPPVRAAHRNESVAQNWEAYPAALLATCFDLALVLVQRYNLDDVTGHDCISPGRRNDPGPAFPMESLREHCGFKRLPVVHR